MTRTIRTFAVAASMIAVFGIGGIATAAPAPPPPPVGSSCGQDKVITDIHTCEKVNSSCTGYDMMIIGRVDKWGHCVFPGMNGTTW